MTPELAKELKDAGFPQESQAHLPQILDGLRYPNLSQLIEACGEDVTIRLQSYYSENDLHWQADTCGNFQEWDNERHVSEAGTTPEEAVARLWLALNKHANA